jgi:hypothetical protein
MNEVNQPQTSVLAINQQQNYINHPHITYRIMQRQCRISYISRSNEAT